MVQIDIAVVDRLVLRSNQVIQLDLFLIINWIFDQKRLSPTLMIIFYGKITTTQLSSLPILRNSAIASQLFSLRKIRNFSVFVVIFQL